MADGSLVETVGLFEAAPYLVELPEPEPKLSPDARRVQRQAQAIANGVHPLAIAGQAPNGPIVGHLSLHPEAAPANDRSAAGRRCGNCWYRQLIYTNGNKKWPKCVYGASNATDLDPNPIRLPRVTGGPGSDIKAWWPACTDHTYGDTSISDDAARYVPEEETADAR